MKTSEEVNAEIKQILIENKLHDLKRFISKRACLNKTNQVMTYLFHTIQSAGILVTTIAAGYEMKELIWVGAGLNILASLINMFEKTNDAIAKKLLKDIYSIKNDTYVDEGMVIDVDPEAKNQDKNRDIESSKN